VPVPQERNPHCSICAAFLDCGTGLESEVGYTGNFLLLFFSDVSRPCRISAEYKLRKEQIS